MGAPVKPGVVKEPDLKVTFSNAQVNIPSFKDASGGDGTEREGSTEIY